MSLFRVHDELKRCTTNVSERLNTFIFQCKFFNCLGKSSLRNTECFGLCSIRKRQNPTNFPRFHVLHDGIWFIQSKFKSGSIRWLIVRREQFPCFTNVAVLDEK
jgi:hypothetical protein